MIDIRTLAAIVGMALATYLTRIGGYIILGGRRLSPQTMTVLDAAPACVLIAVIAPMFVSGHVTDLAALLITAVAAARFSLLPTVLIAVLSTGAMRYLAGN